MSSLHHFIEHCTLGCYEYDVSYLGFDALLPITVGKTVVTISDRGILFCSLVEPVGIGIVGYLSECVNFIGFFKNNNKRLVRYYDTDITTANALDGNFNVTVRRTQKLDGRQITPEALGEVIFRNQRQATNKYHTSASDMPANGLTSSGNSSAADNTSTNHRQNWYQPSLLSIGALLTAERIKGLLSVTNVY